MSELKTRAELSRLLQVPVVPAGGYGSEAAEQDSRDFETLRKSCPLDELL